MIKEGSGQRERREGRGKVRSFCTGTKTLLGLPQNNVQNLSLLLQTHPLLFFSLMFKLQP